MSQERETGKVGTEQLAVYYQVSPQHHIVVY